MSLLTPAGARGTPERGEAEATPVGAGTSLLEGYDVGRFFDEMLERRRTARDRTTARSTSDSAR